MSNASVVNGSNVSVVSRNEPLRQKLAEYVEKYKNTEAEKEELSQKVAESQRQIQMQRVRWKPRQLFWPLLKLKWMG